MNAPDTMSTAAPKRRIGVFSLTSMFGGGELFLFNLARLLPSVELFFCISSPELLGRLLDAGIPAANVLLLQPRNWLFRFVTAFSAATFFWKSGVKYTILNGVTEINCALVFRALGQKTSCVIHTELNPHRSFAREFLYVRSLSLMHRILLVANHLKNHAPEQCLPRTRTVLNRVVARFSSPAPIAVRKTLADVIYVGRISPEKGIDDIFAVAAQMPQITFSLIGNATSEDIKGAAPENVRFLGFHADIEPRLRSADLILFPSRSEGMPYAPLEAAAIGLPIVATAIPAHLEISKELNGMRLYPPGDIKSLRATIEVMKSQSVREQTSNLLYLSSKTFNNEPEYAGAMSGALDI